MRILFTIFLVATCGAASAQLPSRQAMVADALKEYGNITGGLALNDHCEFLSPEASKSFQEDIEVIRPALEADLGGTELLQRVADAAKQVAVTEPYASCGAKAKDIVEKTSGHSSRWREQVIRIQSKGAS